MKILFDADGFPKAKGRTISGPGVVDLPAKYRKTPLKNLRFFNDKVTSIEGEGQRTFFVDPVTARRYLQPGPGRKQVKAKHDDPIILDGKKGTAKKATKAQAAAPDVWSEFDRRIAGTVKMHTRNRIALSAIVEPGGPAVAAAEALLSWEKDMVEAAKVLIAAGAKKNDYSDDARWPSVPQAILDLEGTF